jgi:hypothetical protein
MILCFFTVMSCQAVQAQEQPSPSAVLGSPSSQTEDVSRQQAGGSIHGSVKSSAVPLPGVPIIATNTLNGEKYSAATNINGNYTMTIPKSGRYVLRAEFIDFAAVTKEALLNTESRDQEIDFTLILASKAVEQEQRERSAQNAGARQYSGKGAQSLGLIGSAVDIVGAAASGGSAGAQLPSFAGNGDISSDSVAVSGQCGTTNPFAGMDMDQLRQNIQSAQVDQSITGASSPGSGRLGAGMGGGGGGGGGARLGAIFRNFKPNQPLGAFFWDGSNGALNATDFPIRGQEISQPSYGSNQVGLTFFGAPYIPTIIEVDTKDFLFFAISGQHSSQPFDQYGTVPTLDERSGNLSELTTPSGNIITIYDPTTGQPFRNNTIPSIRVSQQATALLNYIPLPNLPGEFLNYQRLTAAKPIRLNWACASCATSAAAPARRSLARFSAIWGAAVRAKASMSITTTQTLPRIN